MHLTYFRRSTTRAILLFAAMGILFLVFAVWPPARHSSIVLRALFGLCAPCAFYGVSIFVRMSRDGPALSAMPDGLWVNGGRGQRSFAWRDIESIGRRMQTAPTRKQTPVPVIEIVLRKPGKGLFAWPGARPIRISIGMLAEGEAGVERWLREAHRRLDMAAPMAA